METHDEALAVAAGQGDRAAFAALVDRNYDRIFRFAWRLTGNQTAAEDLAQDVCLKLPRALRGFRGEARFSTWLYRVILNAIRDAGRRETTRARALMAYAAEPALGPDEEDAARATWLAQALTQLKPDLAETAALIVGEDLSQAEAAAVLKISPGTVAWRMSEIKKALTEKAVEDGI